MKKLLFVSILLATLTMQVSAQTLHSIIFVNKQEQGRQTDRTAEFNNMRAFCRELATTLGYSHDLRTHSGSEFTSTQMIRDIDGLAVDEGDIVILYYSGHGANLSGGYWPHMALSDRAYGSSTAYERLKNKCMKAKLVLCIAACCNKEVETRSSFSSSSSSSSSMNSSRVKQLFTGFDGKMSIMMSSSVKGQYSWSVTGGSRLGPIFTMSLRDVIHEAVRSGSSKSLEWNNLLSTVKERTNSWAKSLDGSPSQVPQYQIDYKN